MAKKIEIQGYDIRVNSDNYLNITDIARTGGGDISDTIRNYFRPRVNIEFLGEWEIVHNPNFKTAELGGIKQNVGMPNYSMSVKRWIEQTNAIGIEARAGRYGGTYAHKDIAIHFAAWFSPTFCLWMIKEFDRLKDDEAQRLGKVWNVKREISKANHSLQTDAIRAKLVPGKMIGTRKEGLYFANEADLLNMVVFGQTAKQWKAAHPKKKGNQRDHATVLQLAVLANLEALNSKLIEWDCDQEQRYQLLTEEAERQQALLSKNAAIKRLGK
ncbi:MAG: KilA-N domain-containing protein [Bacteroidota bacterium]